MSIFILKNSRACGHSSWCDDGRSDMPVVSIARSCLFVAGRYGSELALSEQNWLRWAGHPLSFEEWQNAAHFATSKPALRWSAWPWWCTSGFRFRFGTWRVFCTNAASTSAMKRFDFGGAVVVRCLPQRSARKGSARCAHIRTGSGTWTTCLWGSTVKRIIYGGP